MIGNKKKGVSTITTQKATRFPWTRGNSAGRLSFPEVLHLKLQCPAPGRETGFEKRRACAELINDKPEINQRKGVFLDILTKSQAFGDRN